MLQKVLQPVYNSEAFLEHAALKFVKVRWVDEIVRLLAVGPVLQVPGNAQKGYKAKGFFQVSGEISL
jgi:hypothetical protein